MRLTPRRKSGLQDEIEFLVLENLIHNEDYSRKVLPFLKKDYFPDNATQVVYEHISDYISKYNTLPTQSEIIIELKNQTNLAQGDFEVAIDVVNGLAKRQNCPSNDWLFENTEAFCKERALYNVLTEAAEYLGDQVEGNFKLGKIPEAIQNALGITFDTTIGLDYSVAEDRWERRRQRKVDKVPFCVGKLNDATGGGMNLKTVTCVAAGTGAGKSALMCAQAAYSMMHDLDVLYITLEMDEDSITDRIDANILGIDLDDIPNMSKQDYTNRINKKLEQTKGRLIVKEYPTSAAGVLEFRALLNDLKLKKSFKPRLICIDYLNICNSSRYKAGVVNSYTLVKGIAEELRGLAKEFECAIMTGTQLNRDGVENENVSLKEISESSGLSHTVDMLFALMRTEELDKLNQVLIKQLKNRFGDMAKMLRFTMGVDRAKFRYWDVDTSNDPKDTEQVDSEKGIIAQADPETGELPWSGNFGTRNKKPRGQFSGINA